MQGKVLLPSLFPVIERIKEIDVPNERKFYLEPLIEYLKLKADKKVQLNFICTHNSRRSQLAQVWAQVAAYFYGVNVECYSGGTEATAFYSSAIHSLRNMGFEITSKGEDNPIFSIGYANKKTLTCFSKEYNHKENPQSHFAAIMTCSQASENCPVITGADSRIPLEYEDPKRFDNTDKEKEMYDNRSLQIASEMFYVFKRAR